MTEWVLPLVVRIERDNPPARTDALEAAAKAVLTMLTTSEPSWVEQVQAWDGSRIRKVVRRARGAEWRRACALPGITVEHRTASVRVFPPVPVDAWPADLARLQVGGTELDDPSPPSAPDEHLPLVLLSPDVQMSAGKAMAQAGHAAQLGWRSLRARRRSAWQQAGFPLAVRVASPRQWRAVLSGGAPVVHDAGFTEVDPGTATAAFVS